VDDMENNLTVNDILKAQKVQSERIDKTKNCDTCKNDKTKKCDKCFNSFMGIPFTPSEWQKK